MRLRADFIHSLRDLLGQSSFRHRFEFVEYSNFVAARITDESSATELARRSGVHFLLYGRARHRELSGAGACVIDLRALVRHADIASETKAALKGDMGQALPNRLILGGGSEMLLFEAAAAHVDAAARYIIGTAAAFSGDLEYSEQLLQDSERRLRSALERSEGQPIAALLGRVRQRLASLYSSWLGLQLNRYALKRDKAPLLDGERLAEKLLAQEPGSLQAKLALATCAFVLRRDVARARELVESCKGASDGIWLYSAAFIQAYEGDLQHAYKTYQRAFREPLSDPTVPTQCEEFIQIVIDEEPDRYWLYFCLGLLNRNVKLDYIAARRDLELFLASADEGRFPSQVAAAKLWLSQMQAAPSRSEN